MDRIELQEGTYNIPNGFTVKVMRGARQIEVKPYSNNRIKPGDYRCRDCKHQIEGPCLANQWWKSKVCEKRPKRVVGQTQLYYAVQDNRFACALFELKDR